MTNTKKVILSMILLLLVPLVTAQDSPDQTTEKICMDISQAQTAKIIEYSEGAIFRCTEAIERERDTVLKEADSIIQRIIAKLIFGIIGAMLLGATLVDIYRLQNDIELKKPSLPKTILYWIVALALVLGLMVLSQQIGVYIG